MTIILKVCAFAVLAGGIFGGTGAAQAQGAPAANQTAQTTKPVVLPLPGPDALLVMIRVHVVAVALANSAGNYEVVRALGSARFKAEQTSERLAKTFEELRALNLDLGPVVVATPVLTDAPTITEGKLRVVGAFPTAPIEVPFGLLFEADAGAWKLAGISVGVRPTAKVAELSVPMSAPVASSKAQAKR